MVRQLAQSGDEDEDEMEPPLQQLIDAYSVRANAFEVRITSTLFTLQSRYLGLAFVSCGPKMEVEGKRDIIGPSNRVDVLGISRAVGWESKFGWGHL